MTTTANTQTQRRVTGLDSSAAVEAKATVQAPLFLGIASVLTRRIDRLNQEFAQVRQRGGDPAPYKRRARVLWEAWKAASYPQS